MDNPQDQTPGDLKVAEAAGAHEKLIETRAETVSGQTLNDRVE
jgi:hypothetical protein